VVWDYAVQVVGARAEALDVEARFTPGGRDDFAVDEEMTRFVSAVTARSGDGGDGAGEGWAPAPSHGTAWTAPCAQGCTLRYRVALRAAAAALSDPETAIASGDVVVAPPSSWLLRPEARPGRFRFRVTAPEGVRFAAATHPSSASPASPASPASAASSGAYEAPAATLDSASFAAFGAFHTATVQRGASRVDLAIARDGLALSDADVAAWLGGAVDAIAGYYGRFPVERALVVVMRGTPGNPTRGVTLGDGGPGVLLRVGDGVTAATWRDDWVATHELLHVTLPSLGRDHVWLSEGIPSYVEPFARARVGLTTPEKVWRDLVDGLPQGLPEAGDEGLEHTHTWGRTYWGGALFCLVADLTIREATRNARSLDDALRAIVATGDDVEAFWEIDRVLDVGDRATGTTALHDLYARLALAPGGVDLAALWARLGVRAQGSTVAFDDTAPLAAVRRSMTSRSDGGGAAGLPGAHAFFDETDDPGVRINRCRKARPMNLTNTMMAAAVGGILLGATGCASAPTPPSADPSAAAASAGAATPAKHACKGQNDCKGQGGCKTDKHGCKAQNDCKGQGGCKG
jgi:hypothetical protein